jgi:hypothetical protein
VSDLGIPQQRFGWYTTDIQTNSTQPLLVHDGSSLFQLRGAYGGHVTCGTSTDNHNIEVLSHIKLQ